MTLRHASDLLFPFSLFSKQHVSLIFQFSLLLSRHLHVSSITMPFLSFTSFYSFTLPSLFPISPFSLPSHSLPLSNLFLSSLLFLLLLLSRSSFPTLFTSSLSSLPTTLLPFISFPSLFLPFPSLHSLLSLLPFPIILIPLSISLSLLFLPSLSYRPSFLSLLSHPFLALSLSTFIYLLSYPFPISLSSPSNLPLYFYLLFPLLSGGVLRFELDGVCRSSLKPIPIVKGDFGQKGYPFLRIFLQK